MYQTPPRRMGILLDDAFQFYRQNMRFLLIAAMAVLIPYDVISGYINVILGKLGAISQQITFATQPANPFAWYQGPNARGIFIAYGAILLISTLLVSPLLSGMVIHKLIRKDLHREDISLSDASSYSFGRLLPAIGTVLLETVIGTVIVVLGFLLVFAVISGVQGVGGVLLGVLLGLGLFVLVIWLAIRFAFTQIAVYANRISFFAALAKSYGLTRKSFWRTLGFLLVISIPTGVITGGVVSILTLITRSVLFSDVVADIINIFLMPFIFVMLTMYYIDLSSRKHARETAGHPSDTVGE